MKTRFFCVVLCSCLFLSNSLVAGKTVLDLKLDKYSDQKTFKGGALETLPQKSAFLKIGNLSCLHFNGRGETLEIKSLDEEVKKTLEGSFTLEFDFLADKLPIDRNHYDTSPYKIDIFSALDSSGKAVLSLKANRYNRITALFLNSKNKYFQLISSWNNKNNYEVTSILRGKWYKASLVHDKKKGLWGLYLDDELAGEKKVSGEMKEVSSFLFGGKNTQDIRQMFRGGIRNIKLVQGALYNKATAKKASKKAWKRLHDSARSKYSKYLLPEDPKWALNHPRMLLTPTRVEALKAALSKGEGPESMARLIKECDAMINPDSPEYLKALARGHDMNMIMKPAALSLATLLTGNEKYALHAAKIVTEFTDKLGYNDMSQQLVMSAGAAKPMMAITLTYDWAYKYLTEAQRRKIRLFLFEIAKGTYDHYNGLETSTAKRDALAGWVANWTGLSISTMGNASLAILGETSGRTLVWLDYAKFRAMQYGMFAVGMDGCFHEMPGYLAFGAGPIIIFMEALYTAGGEDLLMASNFSKFPDCLAYLIYPYSNKMMTLKYSSEINGLHRTDSYIMALLRKKIGSRAMEWDWQKIYGKHAWDQSWSIFPIIWFEPKKEKLESPGLPLAKWFKSEGVVAFRSDWGKDAIAGTFMAYTAKILAHDQSDRGQFNLYGYQGRWIIDAGGRGAPQHAYRDAHNLVTVDNKVPRFKTIVHSNHHHDAFMTNFCHDKGILTSAEADLANSYRYLYNWQRVPVGKSRKAGAKDDFKLAKREILFMREKSAPPYLLVYDEIQEDEKEHVYTLNLHTASENEVTINGNSAQFTQYPEKYEEISYLSRPLNKDGTGRYYYSGSPLAGFAEYTINIPQNGNYDLYGFGRPADLKPGGRDSFFIQFGGRKINWGTSTAPRYRWSQINTKPFKLKKGDNKLTVLLREPEARAAKFALYPSSGGVPLFNKTGDANLILINAAKPDKLVKDFIIGKEQISMNVPKASMTLKLLYPDGKFEKEIVQGAPLPHFRLRTSMKGVTGSFLTFYYPQKPGMEKLEIRKISENVWKIKWDNCEDTVFLKKENETEFDGIKTDADFSVVRKSFGKIVSFAIVNGSSLMENGKNVITLEGGKGIAGWSGNKLVVSGKNVYNFAFEFPRNGGVMSLFCGRTLEIIKAQGKIVDAIETEKGWKAKEPFVSRNVLTW